MKKLLIAVLIAMSAAPAFASNGSKAKFYATDFIDRVAASEPGKAKPAIIGIECAIPSKDGNGVDPLRAVLSVSGYRADKPLMRGGVASFSLPGARSTAKILDASAGGDSSGKIAIVRAEFMGGSVDFMIYERGVAEGYVTVDGQSFTLDLCKVINAQDAEQGE